MTDHLRQAPTFSLAHQEQLDLLRRDLALPLPQPDAEVLRQWSQQVVDWSVGHFTRLGTAGIGPSPTRMEMERLFREPIPEHGGDLDEVLRLFADRVAANVMQVSHPRFLAFIPGAPSYPSILGDWLAAALNCFAGVWFESAGAAMIEVLVLDWFKEIIGYPAEARGILTSGGSEATLTALLVARERLSQEERQRAVLYQSDQRHWSVDRAARIIGLRPDQLHVLPTGSDCTLRPEHLREAIRQDRQAGRLPWLVAACAGTTNTGAVDPLAKLAAVCRERLEEKLWLHVDAAYGWPAVLDPRSRGRLVGLEQADSITLDPHKWFAQTFDTGCLLVREGARLSEPFHIRPEYLQDIPAHEEEINFADHGIALTRRFRALKIWLSVKVLGLNWFRNLVARCLDLAELAELLLQTSGDFEILAPRPLSIVCFRFVPRGWQGQVGEADLNRLNLAIARELRSSGRAFLSTTLLRGRVALRFCFINWRTTSADVEEIVALLQEIGWRLAR